MILGYVTLFIALIISVVSAYYSILGLTAIFAAVFWPIVVMGAALEAGKVMATVWLHKNWDRASIAYKSYLVPAVAFLMLLTSMGVFGFLSKAHLEQSAPTGDIVAKVETIDEKIRIQQDLIAASRDTLTQLDKQVNEFMGRSSNIAGANRSVQIRRQQAPERTKLQKEISTAQAAIAALNEEKAPLESSLRKLEAEVGPIKYVAALIYGDNPDTSALERAVRWVIILIVIVFDPLAIVLILASTRQIEWAREDLKNAPTDDNDNDNSVDKRDDVGTSGPGPVVENDAEPAVDIDEVNRQLTDAKPEPDYDYEQTIHSIEEAEKAEPEVVYVETPVEVIKEVEKLVEVPVEVIKEVEVVKEVPVEVIKEVEKIVRVPQIKEVERLVIPEETQAAIAEKDMKIRQLENNVQDLGNTLLKVQSQSQEYLERIEELQRMASARPVKSTFGNVFPEHADLGDMFVRVDTKPHRLYKWNGDEWINVDKNKTDSYLDDIEYLRHVVNELTSGGMSIDELSQSEQDAVTDFLYKNR